MLSGVVAAARGRRGGPHNRLLSYEGPFGVGYLVGEVEITAQPSDGRSRSVTEETKTDR